MNGIYSSARTASSQNRPPPPPPLPVFLQQNTYTTVLTCTLDGAGVTALPKTVSTLNCARQTWAGADGVLELALGI